MKKFNVDLFLSGHEPYYQRQKILDGFKDVENDEKQTIKLVTPPEDSENGICNFYNKIQVKN